MIIYKNIIIGASEEGIALASSLAGAGRETVMISSNYPKDFQVIEGVEFVEAEVIYLQYSHGLFILSTLSGEVKGTISGLNIILATGTKAVKTSFKNQNICYKSSDLPGRHKSEAVVVYGNNDDAATYALDLSKRFYYVYLCTKEFELACKPKLIKKIGETANIVHLPGCSILSCKNDKNGKLSEVTLDTYATIKSSGLLFALGKLPDIPIFVKRFIKLTDQGFIEVKDFNESTNVPGIFAIGGLCESFTKRDIQKLAEFLKKKGS